MKLSKVERFYSFLRLSERISKFRLKNKVDKNKDNFQIVIDRNNKKKNFVALSLCGKKEKKQTWCLSAFVAKES